MNDILLYAVAITALVISDALLVLLGVVLYRQRRQNSQQIAEQITEQLRQELQPLAATLSILNERLSRIEGQLKHLQERGEQQSLPTHREADHKAFEVAAKLVLQGAEVEELMNICGLTRGEAELIRKLYGTDDERNSALGPVRGINLGESS